MADRREIVKRREASLELAHDEGEASAWLATNGDPLRTKDYLVGALQRRWERMRLEDLDLKAYAYEEDLERALAECVADTAARDAWVEGRYAQILAALSPKAEPKTEAFDAIEAAAALGSCALPMGRYQLAAGTTCRIRTTSQGYFLAKRFRILSPELGAPCVKCSHEAPHAEEFVVRSVLVGCESLLGTAKGMSLRDLEAIEFKATAAPGIEITVDVERLDIGDRYRSLSVVATVIGEYVPRRASFDIG